MELKKKVDKIFIDKIIGSKKMKVGDVYFIPRLLCLLVVIILMTWVAFTYFPFYLDKLEDIDEFFRKKVNHTFTEEDNIQRQKNDKSNLQTLGILSVLIICFIVASYYLWICLRTTYIYIRWYNSNDQPSDDEKLSTWWDVFFYFHLRI